jgi:hypothetical protein
VFSLALPLAHAALSRTLPVPAVASGAIIPVRVIPEEDCTAFAIRAMEKAEREILVGADSLTTGSGAR